MGFLEANRRNSKLKFGRAMGKDSQEWCFRGEVVSKFRIRERKKDKHRQGNKEIKNRTKKSGESFKHS